MREVVEGNGHMGQIDQIVAEGLVGLFSIANNEEQCDLAGHN